MGARRGAGRSAARGRAIRADDCEKAACSTSAARGCSILDRGCSAGHTSQTRAGVGAPGGPRGELWRGRFAGWGDVSPSRPAKPAAPHVTSACRAAAAPWGLLRAKKLLGTGAYRSGVDQGSTAPVRTLALASFSLLTFLSLFLSSFLASLEPSLPLSSFLEESFESLDLSLESLALESFFSSFLTAFSSCVRRARDGARAARGAVDAKNHHAIAAIGASRRHRRRTFFFSFSLALAFSALSYSSALFCLR